MNKQEGLVDMKKRALIPILIFMLLSAALCTSAQAAPALAKKKLNLKTGNVAVIAIKGNKGASVKWSVSDKKKVSFVSKTNAQAVILAKKAGSVTVTAKVGKKKLKCKVKVKNNKAIPGKLQMAVGTTFTFKAKKKASWSVSDPSLATIGASGKKVKIKALAAGNVTVTSVAGSKKTICVIKILNKDGTEATPTDPNVQLVDGCPAKEVLLFPNEVEYDYHMYWFGEVGKKYIYVIAEGNHIEPDDVLVVGVHSNVSGLTVNGSGAVSARFQTKEEAAQLSWSSEYDYIMDIKGLKAGDGIVTISGKVDGKTIQCLVPIFVEKN